MTILKLIEILIQYAQVYGDVEFMYSDTEKSVYEDIEELDLNIEVLADKEKRLVLTTILEEKQRE